MANEVENQTIEAIQDNNTEEVVKEEVFGYSDNPADIDTLGADKYFDALAKYICKCPMPTTIAIQGGWGTGKSTAMRIIMNNKDIKTNTHVIKFETWQYSKTAGQSLIVPLLSAFINKISDLQGKGKEKDLEIDSSETNDTGIVKKCVNLVNPKIKNAFLGFISLGIYAYADKKISLGNTLDHLLDILNNPERHQGDESFLELHDYYNQLENVQETLEKNIDDINDGKRFVVFVDDLDRLNPEDAVGLLEDLKTIMSLKKCVFVLALDHEIVMKGLTKKYGNDLKQEYAEKFFDKIIQLPFYLPISQYNVKEYLLSLQEEPNLFKNSSIDDIVKILDYFEEKNPRTIKRLLNILRLYEIINKDKITDENIDLFLYVIILQTNYKNLYNWLTRPANEYLKEGNLFNWVMGLEVKEEKEFTAEICLDNYKAYLNNHSYGNNQLEYTSMEKRIVEDLPERFGGRIYTLCEILAATSVTSEAQSGSTAWEKNISAYEKLSKYAVDLFDGWTKYEKQDDGYLSLSWSDANGNKKYVFEAKVLAEDHLNLNFISEDPQNYFMGLNEKNGKFDKEKLEDDYGLEFVEDSKGGNDNKTYVIANKKKPYNQEMRGYVALSHVSIDRTNENALRLVGEWMRSFSKEHILKKMIP